ncbi:MAG TPA: four helix bundle protein [Patescibacteria group bacterium]|nr:four helix bundle protein [Patescibacteria group bacterium]
MSQASNIKKYDLEDRTLEFSKKTIKVLSSLPKNTVNFKLIDQLVRSATSIGANYREANETETKKDFFFRIRICRKESKETVYWFDLLIDANLDFRRELEPLMQEASEFVKIFAAIANKS